MESENDAGYSFENKDSEDWKKFTFSPPNILHSPERLINFGVNSDHVVKIETSVDNTFQFSPPTNLQKNTSVTEFSSQNVPNTTKQYKPRISRNTFQAPINVFTQALKGTSVFEQLKKNSKSQLKCNTENSITCTMVPKSLLDKTVAKEYFSTFGDVEKIIIRSKKQTIIVFYATKGEASIAFYKCGTFLSDKFEVQWTNEISKKPVEKMDSSTSTVLRIIKENDDFQEELEALKNLEYNLHEEKSNIIKQQPKSRAKRVKEVKPDTLPLRLEKGNMVKVEKPEFENQIVASIPKATIEELQFIIRQAALTTEDKYKILEARDKLIRLKNPKSYGKTLATAQLTKGTCPDMCPEKERLLREAQRQVSFYELLDNSGLKINHMTAVKQYSRSSADQEEPMPHELRPVSSLKMTMSYLLHEIVNLCEKKETNLGEWYHFLWDRMRGIRKDITQQELCCLDSVELVEQCARFHIFCSERLCTEDSNIFDKKINTENLTKCLQTLKYMYHDLRLKGISCSNEPEFRAYIILLNLNNGSFMWDLQRLPSAIQKSSEVKFAIEVYSSIVSNNYVKFFKLVRKTTYLNASILLRYFNQVRVTAFSVMVKAYCRTISKPYPYPLYELIDILAFEDEKEAIYFCEQVGLTLSSDELHILLNRENFSSSEHNIEQSRAFNLIEYKRRINNVSVGQCIAGKTLPRKLYKNHQPHDSFNSQGYLLEESVSAEDQKLILNKRNDPYEFSEENQVFTSENDLKPTIKSHIKNVFSPSVNKRKHDSDIFTPKKLITSSANSRLNQVSIGESEIDTQVMKRPLLSSKSIEKSPLVSTSQIVDSSSAFAKIINKDILSGKSLKPSFLKPLPPTTTFKFTKPLEQPTNNEFAVTTTNNNNRQHQASFNAEEKQEKGAELTVNETVLKNSEYEKKKNFEEEKILKEMEKQAENISNALQTDVIKDICSSIIKDEMQNMRKILIENIFENLLAEILQENCESILNEEKLFQKTLCEMKKRKEKKLLIKYYKLWKNYTDKKIIKRQVLENTPIWLQNKSLEECAKSLYCKQQDAAIENMCRKRLKSSHNVTPKYNDEVPVEVVIYAGIKENVKSFDSETRPHMFWKIALSWPNLTNKVVLYQRKKIMTKYLNGSNNYDTDPIMKTFQPNAYETLQVCIRNFEGFTSEVNLTGTDALLFIASTSEESKTIVRRLTKTVLSKHKLMPIPLVVILFHDGNIKPETVDVSSDLENLMDSGYISEYTILIENTIDENAIVKLTQSAVLWLAVNKSPQIPLEMDYLERVLRDCLLDELWFRIQGHSAYNMMLKNALNDPRFIINLHTEAITHIMEIILDQESLMYSDFSPEIKKFLRQNVKLPCNYEYFDDAWRDVEYREKVERFVRQLILPEWRYSWPIHNRVQLQKAVQSFCQESMTNSGDNVAIIDISDNLFMMIDTTTNLNFVDIVLLVTKKKIDLMEKNLKVVYNRNHIKHFRTLPWWFKSNVFIDYSFQPHMSLDVDTTLENDSVNDSIKSIEMDDDIIMLDDTLNPVGEISENVRCQMSELYSKIETFKTQLESQHLKNQYLENEIQKALHEDTF